MARWFLVAPELSRPAVQVEDMVGLQRASSSNQSSAVTKRYNEDVQQLKDVLKVIDPFATEESHLLNISSHLILTGDGFTGYEQYL